MKQFNAYSLAAASVELDTVVSAINRRPNVWRKVANFLRWIHPVRMSFSRLNDEKEQREKMLRAFHDTKFPLDVRVALAQYVGIPFDTFAYVKKRLGIG